MSKVGSPVGAPPTGRFDPNHAPALDENDLLNLLWQCFVSGLGVACPRDPKHLIALLVRQSPVAYQFRCTRCWWHSDWFVVREGSASAATDETWPPGPSPGDD